MNYKAKLKKKFNELYSCEADEYFSCGGRFEILGNHTDHNHGYCVAATCDLSVYAAVKSRKDLEIHFYSEGFGDNKLDLTSLKKVAKEKFKTNALIRGVAKYLTDLGYKVGGFDAYSFSEIFPGAGVSSSAAFELLIGQIYNVMFNKGKIDRLTLAKAGQYAENEYFGKSSGLLDQIGVGFGNIVFIDFEDIKNPKVEQVKFPFDDLRFVIVNTGGSHAELSDLYSAIPQDMWSAAKKSGHEFLREGSLKEIKAIKNELSPIEYSRCLHFYGENERVLKAKEALINADEKAFLKQINGSRKSSTKYLKNMMVDRHYKGSPLEASDLAMKTMKYKGACKINGGGFAGSIICVVPEKELTHFIDVMSKKYGEKNVVEVSVRKTGPETF